MGGGQGILPDCCKKQLPGESTSQVAFAVDFARSSGEITLTSILGPSFLFVSSGEAAVR